MKVKDVGKSKGSKKIMGYWEDWRSSVEPNGSDKDKPSYYKNDVAPFTHVAYAFLTLARNPNPESPQPCRWDGKAIYENMAGGDITKIIQKTDPEWKNLYEWERKKI